MDPLIESNRVPIGGDCTIPGPTVHVSLCSDRPRSSHEQATVSYLVMNDLVSRFARINASIKLESRFRSSPSVRLTHLQASRLLSVYPCSLAVANRGDLRARGRVVSASPRRNSGTAALLTATELCFEWNDIAGSYDVEIICPVFHHCPTLSEIFARL